MSIDWLELWQLTVDKSWQDMWHHDSPCVTGRDHSDTIGQLSTEAWTWETLSQQHLNWSQLSVIGKSISEEAFGKIHSFKSFFLDKFYLGSKRNEIPFPLLGLGREKWKSRLPESDNLHWHIAVFLHLLWRKVECSHKMNVNRKLGAGILCIFDFICVFVQSKVSTHWADLNRLQTNR